MICSVPRQKQTLVLKSKCLFDRKGCYSRWVYSPKGGHPFIIPLEMEWKTLRRGDSNVSPIIIQKKKCVFTCILLRGGMAGRGWQYRKNSAQKFKSWAAISMALGRVSVSITLLVFNLSLTEGKQFEYVTTVYLNVNFMQFMMTNAMQYFMIYKPCFRIHLRFSSDYRYLFLC